jgi:hypothetical protein
MDSNASRLEVKEQILSCFIDQLDHIPRNSLIVRLKLGVDVPHFEMRDRERFRHALYRLVTEVDNRWPSNEMWHCSQGFQCRELDQYPTLKKYLGEVHFEMTSGASSQVTDWIEFKPQGGSFQGGGRLDL